MQRLKKALSLLLCCAMLFGVLPFSAFATEPATEAPETEEEFFEEEFFEEEIIEENASLIGNSTIVPLDNGASVTIGGSVEKTIYIPVTSLENGGAYLIVSNDNKYAIANNYGAVANAGFTYVSNGNAVVGGTTYTQYIENPDVIGVWNAVSDSNGYKLESVGGHMVANATWTDANYSGGSVWRYNSSKQLTSSVSNGYWSTTYYVTNNGSSWSTGNNAGTVLLYKAVTAQVSDAVTYTLEAENLAYDIKGKAPYTAQLDYGMLTNGVESAAPAGGTWSFTIKNNDQGIIKSIDENGVITFEEMAGSAVVEVAYTWGDGAYKLYKGVNITTTAPNNYPEYPDEGAVKVNKTGTGIDFQSSGIAQVELSATGVPMKRGVDIIVMLDMSSSMTRCIHCGMKQNDSGNKHSGGDGSHTFKSRMDELKEAMRSLETTLKTSNNSDMMKIAIADFNGFFSSGAVAREDNDRMKDVRNKLDSSATGSVYNPISGATTSAGADAFAPVSQMNVEKVIANSAFTPSAGTNYDHGFDVIYQLGHAIRKQNEENGQSDRELVVIFMSDGAPNQYNFYHAIGGNSPTEGSALWNNWLQGLWSTSDLNSNNLMSTGHSYYYDTYDHDGDSVINEHRMANAIKGDPNTKYKVIRRNNTNMTDVFTATSQTNIYEAYGLGATMYSVGFFIKNDGAITEESVHHVLEQIPSSADKYITADEEGALEKVFVDITNEILYAANNARYVDKMGNLYDLLMKKSTYTDTEGVTKTVEPKIEILSYDVYTRADFVANKCTEDQIGDRKGTYTVLETVTFNDDGTEAYSDKIGAGVNILNNGVIKGKYFYYNTNATGVEIKGIDIPTGTNPNGTTTGSTNILPGETFYWNMGTLTTSELAMRYNVYLTGSMEGVREAGSYATNEYANLYYENYAGKDCKKETVSPVLPWQDANISIGFYLVDEYGRVIVNQSSGTTGSFANKIAITNPVVLENLMLNGDPTTIYAAMEAAGILPEGYQLFDAVYDEKGNVISTVTYKIEANSNGTGSWVITSTQTGEGGNPNTTYVTNYDPTNPSAYSNASNNSAAGDYTHTVVWFAVVWKVQAVPDVVVIDYGLPVDISVLANDMFGDNGKLDSIGALTGKDYTTNLITGFGADYTGEFGTATINSSTGKVRFTPTDMMMNGYEKFSYAVKYSDPLKNETVDNSGYYYSTVTVIPATTIYYEDNFLTYSVWDSETKTQKFDENGNAITWETEGDSNAVQAEDRPGKVSMTDANNIYGYDGVNLGMTNYSLNNARWIRVDANTYAKAEFTFTGTGFDVISMTSNKTGLITAQVYNQNGVMVKSTAVDTYYGYTTTHYYVTYTYTEDGVWVETECVAFTGDPKNGYTTEIQNPNDYSTCQDCKPCDECAKDENREACDTCKTCGACGKQYVTCDVCERKVGAVRNGWKTVNTLTREDGAIYQVPVIQVENLEHGTYEVVLTATYSKVFDHTAEKQGYDLYLDAVRVYNPAGNGVLNSNNGDDFSSDTTIQDAYLADGEAWPTYYELRDLIIETGSFSEEKGDTVIEGLMFVDGSDKLGSAFISDYISYGPNNEVYLAPGQRVAFKLVGDKNIANVHIGIKSANGKTGTYTITNILENDKVENGKVTMAAGTYYNAKTFTMNTSTDMYYDLGTWKGDIIVISNTGDRYGTDGILSLTNIKVTHTEAPKNNQEKTVDAPVYMTPDAAMLTLRAINNNTLEQTPEQNIPETTDPETTEPETEDETTVPETEPEQAQPAPGGSDVKVVIKIIKKLIGRIFG